MLIAQENMLPVNDPKKEFIGVRLKLKVVNIFFAKTVIRCSNLLPFKLCSIIPNRNHIFF